MKGLRAAVVLLTRIPVGGGSDVAASLVWLPVVGALVGLLVAAVYAAANAVLPAPVAAALAVAAGVLVTGALHEDGLADFADAIGGGGTRERRFEILDDPRLGTFGVLAVALSLLVRASAMASMSPGRALAALVSAHALGRAGAVALMAMMRPARGGLGATYAGRTTRVRAIVAYATAAAVALGAMRGWGAAAIGVAALVLAAVARLASRALGGTTGDVLGAAEQAVEAAVLVLATAQ